MKNKYEKLNVLNLVIDILVIVFLISYQFKNQEVKYITQVCSLGIIIIKDDVFGIMHIFRIHKLSWKTIVLITLFILQISVYISDILTKNYQPQALCIITIASMLFQNKIFFKQITK